MDKKLHVVVPIHTLNAESCHGVKMEGGLLSHLVSEVEIMCLPKDLPEYLEIDAEELKLGESKHLSDIKMPEGVEIVALTHGADHDTGVIAVQKTRDSSADEDAPVEEAEAATEGDSEE